MNLKLQNYIVTQTLILVEVLVVFLATYFGLYAPRPRKGHHQMSTADLPANTQSNFIIMFNTQYVKYHI